MLMPFLHREIEPGSLGLVGLKMGFQPYTRELTDANYVAVQKASPENRAMNTLKRATDFVLALAALIFL
ncbi:MAG: hypothetical protein AAGB16_10885, partial [Pseudomonadota bacterium]